MTKGGIFFAKIMLCAVFISLFHPLSRVEAVSFDPLCRPLGCTDFGGPILSFVPVPFCGLVVTVGIPRPIVAIYSPQKYLYNPPILTDPFGPAKPGDQRVLGKANNFNLNIFCPLPIVVMMGVSLYKPSKTKK